MKRLIVEDEFFCLTNEIITYTPPAWKLNTDECSVVISKNFNKVALGL